MLKSWDKCERSSCLVNPLFTNVCMSILTRCCLIMSPLYALQYEVDLSQLSRFEGPSESTCSEWESNEASTVSNCFKALESCIICFDALGPTSSLRQLPCSHTFHQPCIDKWICNRDTKCPLCRETFYHLRRPRQKNPPDAPNTPSSVNRHPPAVNNHPSSVNHHRTFESLKHWCKKRLNKHAQVATTAAVQQ